MFAGGFSRALGYRWGHGGGLLARRAPGPNQPSNSTPSTAAAAPGPSTLRYMCAASGFNGLMHAAGGRGLGLGGGLLLGSGSVMVASYAWSSEGETEGSGLRTSTLSWVQRLEAQAEEMLNPGAMLRKHPVAKLFVEQDHLFETMRSSSQIHEFRCFYEAAPDARTPPRFHSVVQLGRDVCGFPQTVHGGLTAAIIDETFGGLGICMWRSGALGVRLPAYTARLEVDYKKKIPAGSVILCTTELEKVEGRKVWMRAKVSDGRGNEFASARALFVAPRLPGENLAETVKRWLTGGRAGNGSSSGTVNIRTGDGSGKW